MARAQAMRDLSRGDLECGMKIHDAVALVVVRVVQRLRPAGGGDIASSRIRSTVAAGTA